jgi:SAM-dependent methyltransferase
MDPKTSGAPPISDAMASVNAYHRELTPDEIEQRAHRALVGGLWDIMGPLQFEFLKSRGLKPAHKLCDVGCGALRGGIHFVRYLDAGNYYGLDINASLLDAGRQELAEAGLAGKDANLMLDARFKMNRFETKFDFILAVSVFTHLYANHIVRCLVEARKALQPRGVFYATFFEAPSSAHLGKIRHEPGGVESCYDRDPFHYSFAEMRSLADIAGVKAELIGEWKHPLDQRMLAFSR